LVPNAVAGTTTLTLPANSGNIARLENNLGSFAQTTSAQLSNIISDKTGSGLLVFANSPSLQTPSVSTSIKSNSSTFSIFPDTVTSLSIGGTETTSLSIADGVVNSQVVRIFSGDVPSTVTRNFFIGTGAELGSTTNVTVGSSANGLTTFSFSNTLLKNISSGSFTSASGSFSGAVTASQFVSTVENGTSPFVVNSSTKVEN
jgi:hypothetical protein